MTSGEQNRNAGRETGPRGESWSKLWLAPEGPQPARAVIDQTGPHRILLLVDDVDQGDWLQEELRQAGASVAWATRGREGLELLRSGAVDLVVSEMGLPDLPGIDLLRELGALPDMPKVILTTSRHSDFLAARAIERGASAVLCKPFAIEQLLALVGRLLGN